MKFKITVTALTVLGAAAFLAAPAFSEEQPADGPSPEAMARMMPGEHHDTLKPMAGSWTTQTKYWMIPGSPPMESVGKANKKLIFDGRYLEEQYEGQAMGATFYGKGLWGYDNVKKKFVTSWIDSMSTGIMRAIDVRAGRGPNFSLAGTL